MQFYPERKQLNIYTAYRSSSQLFANCNPFHPSGNSQLCIELGLLHSQTGSYFPPHLKCGNVKICTFIMKMGNRVRENCLFCVYI